MEKKTISREFAKDLMPVIQTLAEGTKRQLDCPDTWQAAKYQIQITPDKISIKPEATYRPFEDAEECWNEMQKHQPFGWVKYKNKGGLFCICNLGGHGSLSFLFEVTFERATFADGTPFGIKVEED